MGRHRFRWILYSRYDLYFWGPTPADLRQICLMITPCYTPGWLNLLAVSSLLDFLLSHAALLAACTIALANFFNTNQSEQSSAWLSSACSLPWSRLPSPCKFHLFYASSPLTAQAYVDVAGNNQALVLTISFYDGYGKNPPLL